MIYLDNNTFQQEIFIPRSSVKNDASPEYATKNELENAIENEVIRADEKYAAKTDLLPYATTGWVESQDFATKEWTDEQIQSAITSETERTEETYQKKSEMGIYSTTNEVENMINDAVSGKMDTSAISAYTKTEDFATINGSAITSGGNIVIEGGGSEYSAGSNINIDENNVISVTGITVPTSNTAFTNDAGYVTSGEVESQITGKNYATENWVQDSINLAIESETARTESTYAKIGDIPSLDGYATTGWVESQGYLTEHQDISGKLDTSDFTAYTANTQTELNNKQDASAMTAYYTSAQTDTAIQNATAGLASEEWVESQGYLTGYTETDPVFMASPASGITSHDINNWNNKLDSSGLEPYYTSAQTNNAISDAVSGKADLSAVTAQISEVKAEIEAEIPSKVSDLQNDLNFVNSGDVKTQIESYNYINSGQAQTQIDNSISGKLNTDIFTAYTANTQTELNNKQDASAMTEYATTAFTESTYLKEHQSLSAYTPTSGFSTINGSAITEGGNIVVEETPYSGGTNIDITDHIISVTGITVPTKLSELTNDSGYINSEQAQTQIDNSVSGKVDTDIFTAYTANTKTEIDNAVSVKADSSRVDEIEEVTASALVELNNTKQDILISGTNIKTINNESILGSGNIVIQGGSGSDYSAGSNIDITNNVISVTGITVPTKLSELTNDEGFVNSDEVETQITSKGYITSYTETDPVFQASAASGISEQDITNWNSKLGSSALNPYYTSAQTDTAISNAVSGKQDTLVSGTNIKTINNQSLLGSGNIEIQGGSGGGSNIIELTQAEYDTLTAYTQGAMYVITDAQEINMDNYATTGDIQTALDSYYTSAETDTAISNAVSGKTDKVSVDSNDFECMFPTWNNQGCITGAYGTAYLASQNINDSYITVFSDSDFPLPTIYAPESAGSAGQPLLSNGSGAPVWASYKFQFISQSQYDALATKDSTTIYFIVNES